MWQADMGEGFEVEALEGEAAAAAPAAGTVQLLRKGREQFGHKKPGVPVFWDIEWRFVVRGESIVSYKLTKIPIHK